MAHNAPDLMALVRAAPPQLVAVEAADGRLTYAELLATADQLGTRLGLTAGVLVGVCLPRSAALAVACLGVVAAGAAYVAIDPAQPVARLRSLVIDAGVGLVLTTPELAAELGDPAAEVVPGGASLAVLPGLEPALTEPGLAYVMFTSGSTGTPKGVMVERTGLEGLASWHRSAFDVRAGDRCSQVAGPGFDAAAWELWGTVTAGATLVVPPEELKTDPAGLRDWLVAEGITVSFLPTPLAEAVLALEWPPDTRLRVLLTGGDRLHRAPRPDVPFVVHNNYGVTEATVVATSGPVPADVEGLPSIGSPIEGVDVRVVDDELRDVRRGELLLGGPFLARGYLHDPGLTAERFVDVDGVRWYRTGDLVERLDEGALGYLGRRDQQVQVRGTRIEPGEIEAVLEQHPAVRGAAVVAEGTGPEGPRLVAYLEGCTEDLTAHLGRLLPAAMHPGKVVWLDALPMTPNGKVDRGALAGLTSAAPAAPSRPPGDALEAAVCEMVAELLGREEVGPDENFLLIGGHSLLGAQVVTRLADDYDVEVSLRALFDAPTPAGMAAEVRALLIEQVGALDDETAAGLAAGLR